jgi:hypothetical protein
LITSTKISNTIESGVVQNVIDSRELANLTINTTGGGTARLELAFSFADTDGLSLLIGQIPVSRVFKARLDIDEAFDAGIYFTIGDEVAQGRIMYAAQINAQLANSYIAEPDVLYDEATNIKIYFGGGEATVGSGRIIIYYS